MTNPIHPTRRSAALYEKLEARQLLSAATSDAASPPSQSVAGLSAPAAVPAAGTSQRFMALTAATPVGSSYAAPADPRITVNQNAGWRFALNPNGSLGAPQAVGFNDASFAAISLPHTWAGENTTASGTGWYRKTINPTAAMAGKKLFLHFEAGSIVTTLYIDGVQIDLNPATPALDAHKGGFQTFDFDVTAALNAPVPAGQTGHVVAVSVNNNNNTDIAPANGGDYRRLGGLYRTVSLVAVDPTHVALTESVTHGGLAGADTVSQVSSPGVRFNNSTVAIGAASTTVSITTVLDNLQPAARSVTVSSYLVDAAGLVAAQATTTQPLNASQGDVTVAQSATVANPHLWDGRIDPYLYTLYVEVRDADSNDLLDLQRQNVGIRSIKVNASPNPNDANPLNRAPFLLNGRPYRVIGANLHQDTGKVGVNGTIAGWGRTDEQTRADVDLLVEMGGTAIRTAHYQHSQAFYDYADKLGILVYTEGPINGSVAATDAYNINAQDQYQELVRQNYNHVSVMAWGFGNETGSSAAVMNIFRQYNAIAHGLDSSRPTAFGQYASSSPSFDANGNPQNADAIADILGRHPYTYWYGGQTAPAQNVWQPQGVTEYGGGSSAYQYTDNAFPFPGSVGGQSGGVTTHYHPANQHVRLSEIQYTELTSRTYLWGMFIWQFFDHPTGKDEGDESGINDKGQINRDRVPKDSFYFYKAALNDPSRTWANERVLTISDQFWTVRNQAAATVTVFSNIGVPTLTLNNGTPVAMTPLVTAGTTGQLAIPNTYTLNVTLSPGSNSVRVNRTYSDGQAYTDTAVWTYRNALAGTPTARIDFRPSNATAAANYVADNGAAYGSRNGATYGWLPASGNPSTIGGAVLGVGGTYNNTASTSLPVEARNGVNVPYSPMFKNSAVWEYALPNGVYDVRIGAGSQSTTNVVNNFQLEGQTATIDTNGDRNAGSSDTFFTRVTVADGRLTLAGALGAFNPQIAFIDINRVGASDVPPTVARVTVNNGAVQRSTIEGLTLRFSERVSLAGDAVTLARVGGPAYAVTATNPSGDGRTYVLTPVGVALTALPAGVYDLRVDRTKVSDGTNLMAADYGFRFHRLFGDADGNRRVDADDATRFNAAKGTLASSSLYKSYFDFDRDNDIDSLDALRFRQHLGQSLPY